MHYSVDSPLGNLLQSERALALLDRLAPGLISHPQLEAGRSLPLSAVARFVPDLLTAQTLERLKAELEALNTSAGAESEVDPPSAAASADPARLRAHVTSLPQLMGIAITSVTDLEVRAELAVSGHVMASNGYLHAGGVVTLADTAAAYGCSANLPVGATGFTTLELKSNHFGTARSGVVECVAKGAHLGRSTQVWDAEVRHKDTGKVIAVFRCTQMILYA